jgi:23S rRNA (uridine2552-2'-O)-methyltransferase
VARSKSSERWLKEHFDDPYVKQSQQDGYRSRASYKLLEMSKRDKLIRQGMTVVDLGAAPGGWAQVAMQLVGDKGIVIASDILSMDPIAGVTFVEGDFTEQSAYDEIITALNGRKADLVISDMAPNMSGNPTIDQPKSMYLVELALDMSRYILKPGGSFLAKVFQGEGFDELLRETRSSFVKVQSRKPGASRSRSREMYQLAAGFKG